MRPDCLTPAQVEAARAIQQGDARATASPTPAIRPARKAEPYSWGDWITGASAEHISSALMFQFANAYWAEMVFGDPSIDIRELDLAKARAAAAGVSKIVDAADSDLSRFRAHGGKLIQWHGWNDPAIPAAGSIVYYEDVRRRMGDVGDFYRLYLIPGALHCSSGPGPASVDWLDAMRGWVEQGRPPGAVTATAVSAPGGPGPTTSSQRVCPYPATPDADRCMSVEIEMAPPPPPPAGR